MQVAAELVKEFMAARKHASRYRWTKGNHPEFVKAQSRLSTPDRPDLDGVMVLTAHLFRDPRKYSFVLIFKGERELALDVEPRRSYRNLITRRLVAETHWQQWPIMDAEEDGRKMPHRFWLLEFVKRGNVSYPYRYKAPPFEEQWRLPGFEV